MSDYVEKAMLMDYCLGQKMQVIDCNDIAKFPKADVLEKSEVDKIMDLGGIIKQSKELLWSAYNKGYKQAVNDMSIIELPDDTIIYKDKKYIYINHDVIKYGCGVSREDVDKKKSCVDEIKVGNEVICDEFNCKGIITAITTNNNYVALICDGTSMVNCHRDKVRKTGRHFGIDKILEQMKEVDK